MAGIQDISVGSIVKISGAPHQVLSAAHHKMGRGGAVLKTKLQNLTNGKLLDKTFQGSEKVELAEVDRSQAQFLYRTDDELFFMNNVSFEQFSIPLEQLGGKEKFMRDGTDVTIVSSDGKPISVDLPVKVDLKVIVAPPAIKGDTAQGGTKEIETETGLVVVAPLFIEAGDVVRVNTETGEYVERAKSAE